MQLKVKISSSIFYSCWRYKVPEREATHFLKNPTNRESTYFRYERELIKHFVAIRTSWSSLNFIIFRASQRQTSVAEQASQICYTDKTSNDSRFRDSSQEKNLIPKLKHILTRSKLKTLARTWSRWSVYEWNTKPKTKPQRGWLLQLQLTVTIIRSDYQ